MTRGELAKKYFEEGYNCSQAVALAFLDESGLDRETLLRLTSSFGGGMGRLREVCGAVSGAFAIAGLVYGYDSPTDKESKMSHYARIQEMAKDFIDENGSIVCRVLTGLERDTHVPADRTPDYYKKRPCSDLVKDMADILDRYLTANPRRI